MSLLRRILDEKRLAVGGAALAVAANLLVYLLAVAPLERRSAGAASRAATAAALRQAAERDRAAAQALAVGASRAREELATFYNQVVPQSFVSARTITYTVPPALARRANVRYQTATFSYDPAQTEGPVSRLETKIILQGGYEELRRFIFDLETSPEFLIIDGLALAQGEAGQPLTVTLELSTYFRADRHGS